MIPQVFGKRKAQPRDRLGRTKSAGEGVTNPGQSSRGGKTRIRKLCQRATARPADTTRSVRDAPEINPAPVPSGERGRVGPRAGPNSAAAGLRDKAVARERVSVQTVGKWRGRFAERGRDGLLDEPRPGVPRKIDDAKVKSVVSTEFRRSERSIWGPGMCGKSRRMKARE
jgi:hypothetical protein